MMVGMPILYEFNSIEENLILAKSLGFDFVELNLNFSYCRNEILNSDLSSLLSKYNMEATLHYFDEADFGSYKEITDAYFSMLKKYVLKSYKYIKLINFHNNPGPFVTISGNRIYIYEKEYDTYIKNLIGNFKKIKKLLDKYNIKMVIENIDTKSDIKFLTDNFINLSKEGFTFNLDIGHDRLNGYPFTKAIEEYNLKLDEMHFHDASVNTCHLSLGEGDIDLKKYYNLALKNDSYVLLEVKSSEVLKKSIKVYRTLEQN